MGYQYTGNDYEVLKEGTYEVKFESIELKVATTGTEYLTIKLRVRDDVEQENKNRIIFDRVFKDKDHPAQFSLWKINQLLGTQPDIQKNQEFETINDVINYLTGKFASVNVAVEFDSYSNSDKNTIKSYGKSNNLAKSVGDVETQPTLADTNSDLPF